MVNKPERQRAIAELINAYPIANQEDLRVRLEARGVRVTQATLSRDLREMRIIRVPTPDGARYRIAADLTDEGKPLLDSLLPQFYSRADGVGELIVLKTLPGGAQPVAEAIDRENWPEALGTIAGENTVLLICRSAEARQALIDRIERIADKA